MKLIIKSFIFPFFSHLLSWKVYITLADNRSIISVIGVVAILVLILFFFFLLKRGRKRRERIQNFTVNNSCKKIPLKSTLWDMYYLMIYIITSKFDGSIFLYRRGTRYHKYLDTIGTGFHKGAEYIINNFVVAALFLLLFIIMSVITHSVPSPLSVFMVALFGLFIPNLYYEWKYQRYKKHLRASFYLALTLIKDGLDHGYNLNYSIIKAKQSLKGPIYNELEKTLSDLEMGLSSYEVLDLLAERTRLKEAYTLASNVYTITEMGMNLDLAFALTEKDLAHQNRFKVKYGNAFKITYLFAFSFAILPFIFILNLYFINRDYFTLFIDTISGRFLLFIILLLYLSYIYVVKRLIKAVKKW